jgi:hypothetical protein
MVLKIYTTRKIAPYFEYIRTPNESAMYESMIKGSAAHCKNANNITDSTRKVNLILLSAQEKFLNFKANSSILETSKIEKTTQIRDNITGLYTTSKIGDFRNGSPVMKIAFAGVGNPLNESDWDSSRLNIANLRADATTINKARYGK